MSNKNKIHLFYGQDSFRANNKVKDWKRRFMQKYPQGQVREIHAQEAGEPIRISELLGSSSLFNPQQLFILKNPFSGTAAEPLIDQDDFLNLLKTDIKGENFLLIFQEGSLDKRLKFTKDLSKYIKEGYLTAEEFSALAQIQAFKYFASELKEKKLKIKRDAAEVLFQFCSAFDATLNSWKAHHALHQLSAYCEGKEIVEKEDVVSLIPPENKEDVFIPLLQSFAQKESDKFRTLLDELHRQADSPEQLLGVISALFDKVKFMLAVKELQERNLSLDQIDKELGFKNGRSRYIVREAGGFTNTELKDLLSKLLDIESRVKLGKSVLVPELSRLI